MLRSWYLIKKLLKSLTDFTCSYVLIRLFDKNNKKDYIIQEIN